MSEGGVSRKLAAILYADVAGYSRLTGEDEEGTHRTLRLYLDAMATAIEGHDGRVVHYAGDAVLAEFGSVVAALTCAVDVQKDLAGRNADVPDERKVRFRIGVNLGEVIVDRDDIYGTGVNVAARLQSLAEPGGICVSAAVHDQVQGKLDVGFQFMGRQKVKNIAEPVSHYRVLLEGSTAAGPRRAPAGASPARRTAWRLVLLALALVVGLTVWQVASPPAPEAPGPPSLAVLPFRTIGGGREQRVFSEGLTEDLITALSSDLNLRVIAGAARANGQVPDPKIWFIREFRGKQL